MGRTDIEDQRPHQSREAERGGKPDDRRNDIIQNHVAQGCPLVRSELLAGTSPGWSDVNSMAPLPQERRGSASGRPRTLYDDCSYRKKETR